MTAADTDKDGPLSIAEFKTLDLQALAWFGEAIASCGGGLAIGGLILSATGAFFFVELALNNDGLRLA